MPDDSKKESSSKDVSIDKIDPQPIIEEGQRVMDRLGIYPPLPGANNQR